MTAPDHQRSLLLLAGALPTSRSPYGRRCGIAVYVYRCPEHGPTETTCPMGAAAAAVPCPVCGGLAARVFTAPRLSLGSPARRALLDRTERTRDHPDVVTTPPPRPGGSRRADVGNPALSRLPRP